MRRRALFSFRFYGALRRLKHLGILPEIDGRAQKIFVAQASCLCGQLASSLLNLKQRNNYRQPKRPPAVWPSDTALTRTEVTPNFRPR